MSNEDPISRKAVAKVIQFATYESADAAVEMETIVECCEWEDGVIELAFDMRHNGQRTYLKLNRADLARITRIQK